MSCVVRLIDTAHIYNNEGAVGRAPADSGVPREEIFVSNKIWPTEYGAGKTLPAIDRMLDRLNLDYLDLLLIHQPFGDAVGAWKEMEKDVERGKVRVLGISNFEDNKLDDIYAAATIKPAIHQVECHPFRQMRSCVSGWSPTALKSCAGTPLADVGRTVPTRCWATMS